MAIDRTRWAGTLYPLPGWLCPTCQDGHLRVVQKTFAVLETTDSRRLRRHSDSEPDWSSSRFSALLKCDNAACKDVASICGTTSVVPVYEEDHEQWVREEFVDGFNVIAIQPAPLPFPLAPEIPAQVAGLIRRAAELYWMDPGAAANKLRQATEALLTEQGVRRSILNRKKKKQRLPLHARIVEFQKKKPQISDLLFAVKWISNEGSHTGELKQKDVLDGFEILDQVLEEIYVGTRVRLSSLAKNINRRKGPVRVAHRRRRGSQAESAANSAGG
jgi:hypothetical protein